VGAALLAAAIVVAILLITGGGGTEEASAKTVTFQNPTDNGPDPFTEASDVEGDTEVQFDQGGGQQGGQPPSGGESGGGPGTFGGTGSNLVCDRELLIKQLTSDPEKMRAWAEVLGVEPTEQAVSDYIRDLRPVTLTRDTQVTNHSFSDGEAHPFQAILSKGTAVLVDKYGKPVVRCRCGNPLKPPVFYPKAKCYHCPPHYKPPYPCKWKPYNDYDKDFGQGGSQPSEGGYQQGQGSSGSDGGYGNPPVDKGKYSNCYKYHPKPPPAKKPRAGPSEAPSPEQAPGTGEPTPPETPYTETTPYTTPHEPGGRCEEANAPDRFEEGCQGEIVPEG
jgi:uncharacterized protein DUF6777